VWLKPRWGWPPIIAATLAGIFLDIDHAVAAASLDPAGMMGLGVRPPTHSLLAAALLGVLAWPVLGRGIGFAVASGVAAHVVEDALGPPGVPLLFPLWAERQVVLPAPLALLTIVALSAASLWLGQRRAERRRSE
jgi:membrane-bound metal-dependent hydrolase YbcI (DUF457 family)